MVFWKIFCWSTERRLLECCLKNLIWKNIWKWNGGIALQKEKQSPCFKDKGEIPETLKQKIQSEKDVEVLRKWLKVATKVSTVSEFEEKMWGGRFMSNIDTFLKMIEESLIIFRKFAGLQRFAESVWIFYLSLFFWTLIT